MNHLAPLLSSVRLDWYTPAVVLELVRQLGPIALDPAHGAGSLVHAARAYGPAEDGLAQPWAPASEGLTYVNPPYGREIPRWVEKAHREADAGAEVVALVPARPDTRWFQDHCIPIASQAVCFWRGRITFEGAPAPAPFPSAIVYWGRRANSFAAVFGIAGKVWM